MKLAKCLKRVGRYEEDFESLDFEDGRKLSRLANRIVGDLDIITAAIDKNEQHLERIRMALDTHEERVEGLKRKEANTAKRIVDAGEDRVFDDERKLHRLQFQLKAMAREKKDYTLTRDSLRQWLLDLDRAKGLLTMMQSSLQRNMDRLGVDPYEERGRIRAVRVVGSKAIKKGNVQCPNDCQWFMYIGGRFKRRTPNDCSKCNLRLKFDKKRQQFVAYEGKWPGWDAVVEFMSKEKAAEELREFADAYGEDFNYPKALNAVLYHFRHARPRNVTMENFRVWGHQATDDAIECLVNSYGLSNSQARQFIKRISSDIVDSLAI